jgi:UPF0271 protein
MKTIDLNADLGEGSPLEPQLLPLITSANIALGAHAGSPSMTRSTAEECLQYKIAITAHPGYPDPAHFGRRDLNHLPITLNQLLTNLLQQLALLPQSTAIKPHGAFYNQSAQGHPEAAKLLIAILIARKLPLLGLPHTHHERIARFARVPFRTEGFIDRRYQSDGTLTSRSDPNSIITDPREAADQAHKLAHDCDSLCIHGDSPNAPEILSFVREHLTRAGFRIAAP